MTRELLLPILAIVILLNVGVITYVIGHHGARDHETPRRNSEVRRFGPSEVWGSEPRRTAGPAKAAGAPAPVAPAPGGRTPPWGGEAGSRPSA